MATAVLSSLWQRADGDERPRAHQVSRQNIGFVFQQYNLLPALTAVENAAIPLVIAGWTKQRAVRQAGEVLASLGHGQKARESAQPAFRRPDAAGGDRPGACARAASAGLR